MTTAAVSSEVPIEIAPYSDRTAAAHARFAEKMWPSKRRRREEKYNRWKFRGPEHGPVDGLLLAISAGEVLGQLGLIPAEVSVDGQRSPCQWACDLMVDPAVRRRGIGLRLYEAATARGIVTLGSNPTVGSDAALTRAGFRPLDGPVSNVFPADAAHILGWRIPSRFKRTTPALAAILQPVFRWRGRRMYARARESAIEIRMGDWRSVSELVQASQSRHSEPYIVHGEEFLAWRCNGLAGFSSPLVAARTPGGSYAIVGAGAPYFYVYDWSAKSWEDFLSLFGRILALATEEGMMTLQAFGQTPEENAWLRRAGFLTLRTPIQLRCHPPERFIPAHSRMRYSVFDSDGNL